MRLRELRLPSLSSPRIPHGAFPAAALALFIAVGIEHPCAASPEEPGASVALETVTEPDVHPSLLWFAAQLVPSPEWHIADGGVHFGVRWQVTPLLYSFGIHRKLSPWRTFVVEPLVRHAGSLELFASPEYLTVSPDFEKNWLLRGGLRAYFPLAHRGEYLSCSLGGSAFYARSRIGVAYEAGLYTLGGVVGAQVTFAPTPGLRSTTVTLSLRYF